MTSALSGKAADLRDRLLSLVGDLPEGAVIPSERGLSGRWNVARMTLRRAVDDLVVDGLLVRRHGSGTYVVRPKMARGLGMQSFSEVISARGMVPSSRVLTFRVHRAERAEARPLRIPVGDSVVAFTRLRLADDVPIVVERTTVPGAYAPGLCAEDLNGSLYEMFAKRYGLRVAGGRSTLEPTLPDEKVASWLGIPSSQPCMAVDCVVVDDRSRVLEHTNAVYRGDRYAFIAELRGTPVQRG